MNNSMVAHLWANEQKEYANGSHFFFEGKSIYSYGSHFEAGRIVKNKRGEKAYLIATRYYSRTTATKHMPKIWGALPSDALFFGMKYITEDGMSFVVAQLERIKDFAERYKRIKTEISYTSIWDLFTKLMSCIEFFDLGTPKQLLKKSAKEWIKTKHELAQESDKVKQKHVRELKRIFQIMLNYEGLADFGIVSVIIDEICGEGTWANYTERCRKFKIYQEEQENKRIEKARIEYESRKEKLKEEIRMWKAGEIKKLNVPWGCYRPIDEPNVWLRIKNERIETSKGIVLSIEEGKRLWGLVKMFHEGHPFRHDLVLDASGYKWELNKYENDMLTAGCHRISYTEMESIAVQLGF